MAIYFLLGNLSDDGQNKIVENPNIVSETAATIDVKGAKVLGQYAVLGQYDYIIMVESDSNEYVAKLSVEFGHKTGLHLETLSGVSIGFLAPFEEWNDNSAETHEYFEDERDYNESENTDMRVGRLLHS